MTNPFAERIANQKQRIQDHSGDDSDLRQRLNQLRRKRNDAKQQATQPPQLPWSGQYESTVAQLNQSRDLANAQATADEQMLRKSYGFDDPSDPFSRARTLQENFQNANRATTNNYAAGGQLYAGSLTNAHAIDRGNFDRSWDSANQEYQQRLSDLAFRRLGIGNDYQGGVLDATAQSLQDAVATPVDPAEAPPRNRNQGNNRNGGNQQRNGRNNNQQNNNRNRGRR